MRSSKVTRSFYSTVLFLLVVLSLIQLSINTTLYGQSSLAIDSLSYIYKASSQNSFHNLKNKEFLYTQSKKNKDYNSAIIHLNKLEASKDSIYNLQQQKIITTFEKKYLINNKKSKIEKLNSNNRISQAKINQQQSFLNFALIVLALLLILLYPIFRLYKNFNSQKKKLSAANNEKSILLKEIHHRVKNNLQVISSLLSLQSKYTADNNAQILLREGQDRVQSMVIIHQDLYHSDNLKGVATKDYIEQLLDSLLDSYKLSEKETKFDLDIDDLLIDIDTMIPLGLILNELISNAIKKAMINSEKVNLKVSLLKREECLFLEVADNVKDMSNKNKPIFDSLGQQLINSFANKLKANIQVKNDNGLAVSLEIKNYSIAQ